MVIIGLVIIALGYSGSLWFLRGIWGSVPVTLEFGYQNNGTISAFMRGQGKQVGELVNKTVGIDQKEMKSLVYVQCANAEYISVIPGLGYQITMSKSLRSAGWKNIHRLGLILIASRGDSAPSYSIYNAVISEAVAAIQQKLPISPTFFLRSKSANVAAYASEVRGGIHISSTIDSFDFREEKNSDLLSFDTNTTDQLIFSVPRSLLDAIHQDFLGSINTVIAKNFHFQKTTPQITAIIPEAENIYLSIDKNDMAIGVRKHGDIFGANVSSSINKEQGQRHPKKKAFALPDRSIGYEYVPAATKAHFSPKENNAVCLPSRDYDEAIFLCGKQDAAVLASSNRIGATLLGFMGSSSKQWGGRIDTEHSVLFAGNDKGVDILIQDTSKQ